MDVIQPTLRFNVTRSWGTFKFAIIGAYCGGSNGSVSALKPVQMANVNQGDNLPF